MERQIPRLTFRIHAIRRMFERHIDEIDVRHALMQGEVVEDYPQDKPYPSKLILGWVNDHPLHIVVANAEDADIVVTVYEPDLRLWEPGFKLRRLK